jgi:WD40 repeat protein
MNALPDADLLQAYLNCRLAADDVTALEERLLHEPGLADALLILAREEAILTEWARAAQVADSAATEEAAGGVLEPASASTGPTVPSRTRPPLDRLQATAYLLSAAAVILLAVLGVALRQHWQDGEPVFLADLEEVQGDVSIITASGLIIPARPGQRLFAEQELRTGGEGSFAVVKYEDKTRLELSSDTLIRLLGEHEPGAKTKRARGKKVFLNEGILAAEVVKQPQGYPMVLTTPHAIVEVRESMFSSSSAKDATRIELDGGHLQFTRKSDGRSIEVANGSYAVAADPAEPFVPRPLPARVKKPRAVLKEGPGPVLSLAYSPDGKTLALGCRDGSIRLHVLETGAERTVLAGQKKASSVVFSRDGKTLAAVVDDRTVKLWDTATLHEQMSLSRRRLRFTCVGLSPDGRTLATGCGDKTVRLWDTSTGKEKAILRSNNGDVLVLAFSPDGKTLAAGGGRGQEFGTVVLWDVPARAKQEILVGHDSVIRSVAFSPDGQTLASASDDRTVRLWDGKTGQARGTLTGHAGRVLSLAFSPDGVHLASASNDNTARLWDLATGKEQVIFKARKQRTWCLAFSPDGKILATGGWDKSVRLWDATGKDSGVTATR